MTDTTGKRRGKTASGKSRIGKPPRTARKAPAAKAAPPPTVADLSAADIVEAVEQTLAGSVDSTDGKNEIDVAIEEAASNTEPLAQAEPDRTPTPAEAVASPADDNEDRIDTEPQFDEEIEQKGTQLMADVIETTRKYTEEAKERFQTAFSEMSDKAKTGVEKSTKAIEELGEITRANVEALVESGRIASKGIESLGQDAAEFGRVNFEKASAAMRNLAAVKSPAEFFQVQSELLSSAFDSFAKETAKQSEALLKLAGDVAQPISTRVSVVTEKVRSLAA